MARNNQHVLRAKDVVNDEFYTQYKDIHAEIQTYIDHNPDTFRGKTIYCNCDNPYYSQFFRYFVDHFNEFGLRQLMATNYWAAPYDPLQPERAAHRVILRSVPDYLDTVRDEWNATIDQLKIQDGNEWTRLKGCGDFRSPECLELLEQADIVVTNPPFSLFREYVRVITTSGKKFMVIGNKNAIISKEVFPLIRDNLMWVGASSFNNDMLFIAPEGADFKNKTKSAIRTVNNVTYLRAPAIWMTNIRHIQQDKRLSMVTMRENMLVHSRLKNNSDSYQKYDNYDAIEVPYTYAIPSDYKGVMGVPISFMDQYNPLQFSILGCTSSGGVSHSGDYGKHAILNGKVVFSRIFIRHRNSTLHTS